MFEGTTLEATKSLLPNLLPITAIPDTMLSVLTRSLAAASIADQDEDGILGALNTQARDVDSGHTQVMTEISHQAAQAVRATLNLSRNVINPHLKEVVGLFDELRAGSAKAALSPWSIVKNEVPEIYLDPIVNDVMSRFTNMAQAGIANDGIQIGTFTREDIMRLLTVSEAREIDSKLREVLTCADNEGLNLVIGLLQGGKSAKDVLRKRPDLALPLIIILEAIEEPGDGIPMTLAQWTSGKTTLLNNAATTLRDYAGRHETVLKNGILYDMSAVPASNYFIHVNHDVYLRFLERGLTKDALIGNEILRRKYRGEDILAHIAELEEVSRKEHLLLEEAFKIEDSKVQLMAMLNAVRKDTAKRIADGAFVLEGDTAEKVNGRLRGVLERISTGPFRFGDQVLNITTAILVIWYAHTDAARFMEYRLQVEQENKGLTGAEIATLATVRYVVAWVVSQITTRAEE